MSYLLVKHYLCITMASEVFCFKEFAVRQVASAMKVGTDSVLLGAWAGVEGARSILDVGTGTGVVALMAAQRNRSAMIDAVEIDSQAALEATLNFRRSPWADRLRVECVDFKSYSSPKRYDVIVSNPPYFISGKASPDARRACSRHPDSLPFEVFFAKCRELLSERGRLSLIAPVEVKQQVEFLAGEQGLWMSRRLSVSTTARKQPRRLLWEFSVMPSSLVDEELCLQSDKGRSDEYDFLTKDFYL